MSRLVRAVSGMKWILGKAANISWRAFYYVLIIPLRSVGDYVISNTYNNDNERE